MTALNIAMYYLKSCGHKKKDGNGKIIDYVEISIYESEAVR